MKSYTMSFCLACLSLLTLTLTACQANTSNGGASTGVSAGAGGGGPNGGTVAMPGEGRDITAEFLKTYVGTFVDPEFGEGISLGADGSYSTTEDRQVGYETDPAIPYPTLCTYKMTGKLTVVISRSAAARIKYMRYADTVIETNITHIDLIASPSNSAHCDTFIARQQKAIDAANGAITDTTFAELLNPNQIRLHTSGGGDYVDGGPRTPSTLDEVHNRVDTEKK